VLLGAPHIAQAAKPSGVEDAPALQIVLVLRGQTLVEQLAPPAPSRRRVGWPRGHNTELASTTLHPGS
jgi:hypothetical protein